MSSVSGRGSTAGPVVYQAPQIEAPMSLRQAAFTPPSAPVGSSRGMSAPPPVDISQYLESITAKIKQMTALQGQGRFAEAADACDVAARLTRQAKSYRTNHPTDYEELDGRERRYIEYAAHFRDLASAPPAAARGRNHGSNRLRQPARPCPVPGAGHPGTPPPCASDAAAAPGSPDSGQLEPEEGDTTLVIEAPNVSWDDIGGIEDAKQDVRDAVETPLRWAKLYTDAGVDPVRGVLLFGPPGTGKTMLAQAAAHEVGCSFFNVRVSDIVNKFLGESEQRVREIFECAERMSPSILFLDECDALFSKRSESENEAVRRIKLEFMTAMQGFKTTSRVIVIGATNVAEALDEGILRRFEKRLFVPAPDEAARKSIFQKKLSKIAHNFTDQDFEEFARRCNDNYTGADIVAVVKDAANRNLRPITRARYFKKDVEGFDVPAQAGEPGAFVRPEDITTLKFRLNLPREAVLDAIARNAPTLTIDAMKKFRRYFEESLKRD